MNELFTPAQLDECIASIEEQFRSTQEMLQATGPDFMKEYFATGRPQLRREQDLKDFRARFQVPMALRLEEDLMYWLAWGHDNDLKPWCELALTYVRSKGMFIGSGFPAAMSVLVLMKDHLGSVPATLDAESTEWEDYTEREPSPVVRQMILEAVKKHPLYRTSKEIWMEDEADAAEMVAEWAREDALIESAHNLKPVGCA
jgi:hypothetical protein